MPHLVKASEIRELLDLESNSRVYDLARRAIIPGVVRIGRQVRFNIDKVLEFVEAGGQSLPAGWRRAANAKRQRPRTDECGVPSLVDRDLGGSGIVEPEAKDDRP